MTYQVNRLAVSRQAPVRKRSSKLPIFNTLVHPINTQNKGQILPTMKENLPKTMKGSLSSVVV